MNLLQTRRPRPFSHKLIYADESKDRIGVIEKRARRELGMIPPYKADDSASSGSHFQWRRKRARHGMSTPQAIALIVVLSLLLFYVI